MIPTFSSQGGQYTIETTNEIFVGIFTLPMALDCPSCRGTIGLRLTTRGDGHPVHATCPRGHQWTESRTSGAEVKGEVERQQRYGFG